MYPCNLFNLKKKDPRKKKRTKRMRDGDKENGEQTRRETMSDAMLCVCALLYGPHAHAYTPSLSHSWKKYRGGEMKTHSALDSSWAAMGAA